MASEGSRKRTAEEASLSPEPDADIGNGTSVDKVAESDAHTPSEPTQDEIVSRGRSPSEEGEERDDDAPLPDEEPPPLPDEEPPKEEQSDDGWDAKWDYNTNAWYYYNRFTGLSQWENPRVPEITGAPGTETFAVAPGTSGAPGTEGAGQAKTTGPPPNYMGYNPKIHGDFDPNADYAKYHQATTEEGEANGDAPSADDLSQMYQQSATFNRFTGSFQSKDKGPDTHNDENKSRRQMEAFFDVDKAANSNNGQSLKAQRQRQKLSKKEIQEFNSKKKAKKINKEREWLKS